MIFHSNPQLFTVFFEQSNNRTIEQSCARAQLASPSCSLPGNLPRAPGLDSLQFTVLGQNRDKRRLVAAATNLLLWLSAWLEAESTRPRVQVQLRTQVPGFPVKLGGVLARYQRPVNHRTQRACSVLDSAERFDFE